MRRIQQYLISPSYYRLLVFPPLLAQVTALPKAKETCHLGRLYLQVQFRNSIFKHYNLNHTKGQEEGESRRGATFDTEGTTVHCAPKYWFFLPPYNLCCQCERQYKNSPPLPLKMDSNKEINQNDLLKYKWISSMPNFHKSFYRLFMDFW